MKISPHVAVLTALLAVATTWSPAQAQVMVGQTAFQVQGLVGVGRMPSNLRDSLGETFGSISGMWTEAAWWSRNGDTYTGRFLAAPDRGYNVAGTTDYDARLNDIAVSFKPAALGASGLGQNQIGLTLTSTTRLFETLPSGATQFFTGLDPVPGGVATGGARPATATLPELPQARNGKLALDAEGVVVLRDGTRLISDEYGPSIYRFSANGEFIGALPVAASVRPVRNGVTDYSSNNPGAGQAAPTPANPSRGRANNQGFEGLALSPDGKTLFVALQSAARQDGAATGAAFRNHARLFTYDVSNLDNMQLTGEYAVELPKFVSATNATLVAAQSELLALSDTQLLILPRDSNGLGVGTETSLLRRVDVIDLMGATNFLGAPYESQIAPAGVLNPAIKPVAYQPFLNINNNAELARYGLVNGPAAGLDNLSEKWEGLALVSAMDPDAPDDYFLFVANDNDFSTRDGFQVGAAYDAGINNDTMFLAWRVTIAQVPEPTTAWLTLAAVAALLVQRRRAVSPARQAAQS